MKPILFSFFLLLTLDAWGQQNKPKVSVERIKMAYKGKTVTARKLTVSSEIPISLDRAWNNVKTPALLEFVARGMARFKPTGGGLPEYWQEGETYAVKTRIFGFLPFGGKHHLFIDKVDEETRQISTREWNKLIKIWNHDITLRQLGDEKIYYEDTITVYGGLLTGFITTFARRFYKHRQKRWRIVAEEGLEFGTTLQYDEPAP